jgi:hypothetical protein
MTLSQTRQFHRFAMTAPKVLPREIATSFHAAKRNRDLSGFDAINQA